MDTKIHSGKGDQHRQHRTDYAHPFLPATECQSAVCADRDLRVTGWKGVPGGIGARRFHDGKCRIAYPRPRYTAGYLQELIEERSGKPYCKQEVSLPLVHAPEHQHPENDEQRCAAKLRNRLHQYIQHRIADGFQQVQEAHVTVPAASGSTRTARSRGYSGSKIQRNRTASPGSTCSRQVRERAPPAASARHARPHAGHPGTRS